MNKKGKHLIGLVLCIISILIILWFEWINILIIIPIMIYLISILIKNKYISIFINSILIVVFLLLIASYRIPFNKKSIIIKSQILYQVVDFGQGDLLRNALELKFKHKRIFLVNIDSVNNIKWLYVTNSDFEKLWSEPISKMETEKYTLKARFTTHKLFFSGYSIAKVDSIEQINEYPIIRK